MTWNMASARQRSYRVRKYKPVAPIGPERVQLCDRAGELINGVEYAYTDTRRLFGDDVDDCSSCDDCGYLVCSCDEWCSGCEMSQSRTHDRAACLDAHEARTKFVPPVPTIPNYNKYERITFGDPRYGAIVESYVNDAEPPAGVDPRTLLDVLNEWALSCQSLGFRYLTERGIQRAKSWLISMQFAKGPEDMLGMLQLLHSFNARKPAAAPTPETGGTAADFAKMLRQPRPSFQVLAVNEG